MSGPGKNNAIIAQLLMGQGVPTPRPSRPEDALSPGQLTGLQYSRDRMNDGSYQTNPDGSITSFMGSIMDAPEGGFINFPTFWGGQVLDPRAALAKALEYEQKTGQKFARYPSIKEAEAGESAVHSFMERDAEAARNRGRR